MAEATYVSVTEDEFTAKLVDGMGFTRIYPEGTAEAVYERDIVLRGMFTGYRIRVYSSVARGQTRDVGEDAIRIMIIDGTTDYPVRVHGEKKNAKIGKRVNRAASATKSEQDRPAILLERVRLRCLEFWAYVRDNPCAKCDTGFMVKRSGKHGEFRGCSHYPTCNNTENAQ
jgi:hypothetical protein